MENNIINRFVEVKAVDSDGEVNKHLSSGWILLATAGKTTIHEIIHILENHFNCHPRYIDNCEIEVKYIIKEMQMAFI